MGLYGPVIPGCLTYATAVLAESRQVKHGWVEGAVGITSTALSPPSRRQQGGEYCHNVKGNVTPDFQRERCLPALM